MTEKEAVKKLRVHLYGGEEPESAPMTCAGCGRPFRGGTFRVRYQAGWFCRDCYERLALCRAGERCIGCKEEIAAGDWRYRLWSVTGSSDDLQRLFVHQKCEQTLRQPQRAA